MFRFTGQKSLKLGELDAAIVLKKDGAVEISLPKITTETVPENILTGAALMYALSCPEMSRMIRDRFLEECCTLDHFKPSNDH